MEEKAIFKMNGSLGAILCSSCRRILKTRKDFTTDELMASRGKFELPPQYCEICASGEKGLEVCLD